MNKELTSAYGALSSRVNPGSLLAAAYCATFEDEPILPQSYFWVVGMILKTADILLRVYRETSREEFQTSRRCALCLSGIMKCSWLMGPQTYEFGG